MSRQNLSQQTADRLYTTIVVEQQLQPGEKLPNELELAQQLGVSRATLREAIRTLADRGVLEVHRGRGTFVSQQVEEIGDFGFSSLEQVRGQLRDLFELRSMFEPRCAALACRRAAPEELSDILEKGATAPRRTRPSIPPSSGPPTTSSCSGCCPSSTRRSPPPWSGGNIGSSWRRTPSGTTPCCWSS